jgi:hypothetical protein
MLLVADLIRLLSPKNSSESFWAISSRLLVTDPLRLFSPKNSSGSF